jgi:uncharacterized protein DUF1800
MQPSLLLDEHVLLNFPHPLGPRPKIPAPPRDAPAVSAPPRAFASRRVLLSALSGGVLGTPPTPSRAPHRDPVLTLVHRITQGFNLPEYERARAMGYDAYLEEQLEPLAIDDSPTDTRLADHFETLFMSPKELYDTYSEDFEQPYLQFKGAMLLRSTNSKRQLLERMCEFWSDHFNIDHNKGDVEWMLLPEHDRTVIRPHALGKFPDMLRACAFSPAMLYYLDNWLNVRGAPQANYARELLELHTLSVDGGYNESDVDEVAKCFTGWTLKTNPDSPDWMRTRFDPDRHTWGKKFVLGNEIAESRATRPDEPMASQDAHKVLDICAAHPSTADFIARKLIRWLLTPTPPAELVQRVVEEYLSTQGDIRAMLRVILARENMRWAAPVVQPKFRRPFGFMVALFRTLDGVVRRPPEALTFLADMGQMPYDFPPPTGYPDDVQAWGSLILPRWNFASRLFQVNFGGAMNGVNLISPLALMNRIEFHGPSDRPGLAQRIDERLLGNALSEHEREVLQQFIDGYPTSFETSAIFDTLGLAVSLPGYQWH